MKPFIYLFLVFIAGVLSAQTLQVKDLSCEHKVNPVGIDVRQPRLSWKLNSDTRNTIQDSYEIRVATKQDFSAQSLVWSSGKVKSSESILQIYKGKATESGKRYYWQVRVWDTNNKESAWSETAFWEMGILLPTEWKAKWIAPGMPSDTLKASPASLARKEFTLNKPIASAKVYVTAYGMYELYLNGQRVGQDLLTPGWTSYNSRLQYQVYDVTEQVRQGKNAVGAMIGDGWYRGTIGFDNSWNFYGNQLALLCQLQIRYQDGSQAIVGTDETWKSTQDSPVRSSEIYNGEVYDARMEKKGWDVVGFNDKSWHKVRLVTHTFSNLIGSAGVPVRKIQEIKPTKIFRTPEGILVADMGQNMVGWIKLKVSGSAGTKVVLRHSEILDKKGNFYTANLRQAKQRIEYILKGEGEETFEPHFTFQGFRFVAIEGFPGEIKPENLTGIVIHSDMKPIGTFECSNALVNQLQHNIQWGQKGNFVDVPTDCPQRDERLGWTGDAQVFCRTAGFNMDVAAFFTKWMRDVAADQYSDGGVPFVIPDVLKKVMKGTSAGWGDVALITPYTLYQIYGDKQMLEVQYPSMKAYVEYIHSKAGKSNIWRGGSVFGDWLFYRPGINSHPEPDGYTNNDYIATAFYAYSTHLLKETAHILGKQEDESQYAKLFEQIRETFIKEYVTPAGRIASDSQTAYVLALMFNLLPADLKPMATQHLVDDIKSRRNHLSTGFLGTPYLCHVLSDNGHTEVGYDLLLQESYPSWLYPVKMGATTIWERWDGMKPDSTFQDEGMNSFNHYAYGAIGDWMYRVVAGIEVGKPGYKHILIQPQLPSDDRLTYAKASVNSPYGEIMSGWEQKNGQLKVTITIPANTTATIRLPRSNASDIKENGQALTAANKSAKMDKDTTVIEVGSGQYIFDYPLK
ncbi:glycoside hydrolase family 78 protein [Xanthocytophaga flava]|uniref:glycoside hydrolase family 78 protein n=1 Tax=Xanthocytophaga flava TaxID=3048013 RepID=UPI0028D4CE8B|nr:glycoside hydrolase family 78 protein [Xanthocytophaga flavus]MDJ1469974.1 glycoside hydrolase family 78 protein [Xanthocytophaga flavus]